MPTVNSKVYIEKLLLVWPTLVPDKVHALFSMVFMNLSGLVHYVSKDITKTDGFHLIIPLDSLEHLLNDPVYQFPQVKHIDVIYDSISDLKRIKRRLGSEFEKVRFCTIYDLLRPLITTLVSSDQIDRGTIDAILSVTEDRLYAKKLATFTRLSPVLTQFACTYLHGLPVKNINEFALDFICPSCKLVYQQPYKLECGHQQCEICVNIQKKCATCPKAVSRDKVLLDRDLQMKIQDLLPRCSACEWTGPLKDYQVHLKQNHHELITCLIRNQEVDESAFYQQYLTETNQEISLDKVCSLNGTCIWEVSDIGDIKNNAASDQPKSIYSCPFYSFRNGYKMCLRLYINGDCKARDTHMSLFFVIMRGAYDDNLQWPFKLKVTFSLIDQSRMPDNQHHMNQFCWPNTTTMCFQRPNASMNAPYGIPMCFPLDSFKQNQNRYVQNDTMFIKIDIDCLTARPTLPLMVGAGELPNDEEHVDTIDDNLSLMICHPDTLQ